MPAFIFPGRAAKGQRPPSPQHLNERSPQYTGLSERIAGEYPAPTFTGRPITYVGTFDSRGTGRPGPVNGVFPAYNQSGSNVGAAYVETPQLVNTSPFTVLMRWYPAETAAAERMLCELSAGGGSNWSFNIKHFGGISDVFEASVVTTSGGPAGFNATGSTAYAAGNLWMDVGFVWRPGSGLFLFVNGKQDGSNTTTTTINRDVSRFSFYGNGSSVALNGSLADIRIYTRALTDTQVWAYSDPATRWDLYWVPGRRVFFDVGAAGITAARARYMPLTGVA